MGSTIRVLDTSGWSEEALERRERFKREREAYKAFQAARAAHPLVGVVDGLGEESRRQTMKGRLKFWTRDFGNGHREAGVMREIPDPQATLDRAIDRDLRHLAPRGEGDREASIESSVRRAKKNARHKCKALGVNALWTLTFRELVTDREVALRCLDRFRRKLEAVLPGWKYVAVFEKQARGAWHIHMATHTLPRHLSPQGVKLNSYTVMQKLWRSVVGALGGAFDQARKRGRWGAQKAVRGAGAIASYIAGYVAKDFQDTPLNRKRYSASKGVVVPEAYRAIYADDVPMIELVELCYAAIGDRVTRAFWDSGRQVFFIESDDSGTG